jgi:hypothetical protein
MSTTSYINAPKQGSDDSQKIPGRFYVEYMYMEFPNVTGDNNKIDIREIVTSFNITAEIFSPILTLSGSIRDTNNKLGKFLILNELGNNLTGQEKIHLKISAGYDDEQKEIIQRFAVKEYPNYIKTLDFPNNQIFTFVAVSEFAYTDRLMKICRPVKQNTFANIEKIFKEDLGLAEVKLEGDGQEPVSKFDGLITIQSPLSAAEWLRSRSFDDDQSPFFLYNKVTYPDNDAGTVYFASFSKLAKAQRSPSIDLTYKYRQPINDKVGSDKAYEEEQTRILSMTSNLKLDRLKTALEGGYSNRLNVTDFAAKTYYTLDYTTEESKPYRVGEMSVVPWKSNKYKVDGALNDGKTLHDIPESSISGVQINFAPTYGDPSTALTNSVTSSLAQNIQRTKSFIARMNEYDHEIIVYGKTRLNPGTILSLEVPTVQPYNPNASEEDLAIDRKIVERAPLDATASGRHLITVASHNFVDGVYTCKLKLFKIEDLPNAKNNPPINNQTQSQTSIIAPTTATTTATSSPATVAQRASLAAAVTAAEQASAEESDSAQNEIESSLLR